MCEFCHIDVSYTYNLQLKSINDALKTSSLKLDGAHVKHLPLRKILRAAGER